MTFRSADNAVVVTGEFVAFDESIVTLASEGRSLSFRADGMVCEGADCPDLAAYVPRLRMVGGARMGDVLLPALIDAFARDKGWTAREAVDGIVLVSADGMEVLSIPLTVASSDTAFEQFISFEADALLSMRELRRDELRAAEDAGLGRLDLSRQGRILALDALVPAASASAGVRSISINRLTEALAGESGPFEVHMPANLGGQLEGFDDRFMRPLGLELGQSGVAHDNARDAMRAVEEGENGLTLLPFGAMGNTQPLTLTGPCGLRSEARFLTLKTEDYPLTFPMFLYLPQRNLHPQIDDFLDWLRSPSAQLVVRRAGFVDLTAVPIPLADQGDRLASAIISAGPEIPLGELQRMVHLLTPRVRMSTTFRFEPGSTRLDGQSRSNVMQLAQAIRDGRFGGQEIMFVGFSDGRGPAAANRDLSAARAEAVHRDVVRALDGRVPRNVKIETEGFGEALPMACDNTVWGQQTNRRVELWVRDAG